ncbi:MAG TPA: gliding motility-associated ABC transporter ATP-binding subunit GldA, partial [Phnomibacter sp.]|nr:gliding motility-associated ABC transporter ATP-binding subunit GldA [Phnomibacter sp.]
ILHQPRVLILDEPTSGLDPNQILEIRQLIKELGINRTVLLSTHIMQEVEALCERVIIINRGNIVANDLLTNLVGPAQQTVLQVTFAEPLEAQWLQRLDEQAVITRTQGNSWQIETSNLLEYRKSLLQMANTHNLNIVALQATSQSLEEVFRKLTQPQPAS